MQRGLLSFSLACNRCLTIQISNELDTRIAETRKRKRKKERIEDTHPMNIYIYVCSKTQGLHSINPSAKVISELGPTPYFRAIRI
jgi:hypothetical protein